MEKFSWEIANLKDKFWIDNVRMQFGVCQARIG